MRVDDIKDPSVKFVAMVIGYKVYQSTDLTQSLELPFTLLTKW